MPIDNLEWLSCLRNYHSQCGSIAPYPTALDVRYLLKHLRVFMLAYMVLLLHCHEKVAPLPTSNTGDKPRVTQQKARPLYELRLESGE